MISLAGTQIINNTVVCVHAHSGCAEVCDHMHLTTITQFSHSLSTSPSVSAPAQSWSDVGQEDTPLAPASTSSGQEEHHHI